MLSLSKYSSEYPHSLHTYLSNCADDRADWPIIIDLPDSGGTFFPGTIIILLDPHFGHLLLFFTLSPLKPIYPSMELSYLHLKSFSL